jgi:uroporphyrinogen decarboxylase
MKDRFLRALKRQPVDKTPIWLMRQAGRYLPEYRSTREKAGNFLALCKTPELACEVTLQPLTRYALDAAIIFSDILTIPDAMGLELSLVENVGPVFNKSIENINQIKQLDVPDPYDKLNYVAKAITLVKKELNDTPLIGFAGSPWTLAAYMVEGRSSRDFAKVKKLSYSEPDSMHLLLQKLSVAVTSYLKMQIEAGADAIMLFDTWGGLLSESNYASLSLNYMGKILRSLEPTGVPTIVFTKGGGMWLDEISRIGSTCVGLDWMTDIKVAKQIIGHKVALQGNLDPAIMLTTKTIIEKEAKHILDSYGIGNGHIFNLGHGITPEVPPKNVKYLVDFVHSYSQQFHDQSSH